MLGKVKDKLRKAGSSLREFDDAYAAKVAEGAHPLVQMTSGFPITYAPSGTAAEKAAAYGMLGERSGEVRATGRRRHAGRQRSVRPDADDDGSTVEWNNRSAISKRTLR